MKKSVILEKELKWKNMFTVLVAYLLCFCRELQVTGWLKSKLRLWLYLDWQECCQTSYHHPEPTYTECMDLLRATHTGKLMFYTLGPTITWGYLLETGDLLPRPMAPSRPEFSLSSPSCSSLVCSLNRPKTTPDTSVWPDCGCSCSAARFSALCHQRNSLASSPGPLDTKNTP